jgi:hypothetical protein
MISEKPDALRIALALLAILQIAAGIAIYRTVRDDSGITVPAPFRMTFVFLIQGLITWAVAFAARGHFRQNLSMALLLTVLFCFVTHEVYVPRIAGRNVDIEKIRH